jgi:Protein of unknown function (DUF2474)
MARLKRLAWFVAIWATSVMVVLALGQLIRLFLKP